LAEDKTAFDVLRAAFPAGTVSGAPKIRAMEIIDELEKSRRGPYTGIFGYFSFSGNLDTGTKLPHHRGLWELRLRGGGKSNCNRLTTRAGIAGNTNLARAWINDEGFDRGILRHFWQVLNFGFI